MINGLKYEEILALAKELKVNADIIEELSKNKEVQELLDFSSTVEGYSKFLETTVELHKDADKALKDLITNKK